MGESGPRRTAQPGSREGLWQLASARGMGRRQFLRLMVAGGAAAVLAVCLGTEPPSGPVPASPWFKDPGPLVKHGTKGLESRHVLQPGLLIALTVSFSSATTP